MFSEGASLHPQMEALERKCASQLAVYRLRPVVDQIAELWNIAVAKKQPKPDLLTGVRKIADAGFRLPTFTALPTYYKDCRKYGDFPDANEIADKLFPRGQKVALSAVLPGVFRCPPSRGEGI